MCFGRNLLDDGSLRIGTRVNSRTPNHVYDIRVLQPHLHRLFDEAKQQFLERFAPEELGYVLVQLYNEPKDFFVGFGTKEGNEYVREQKSERYGRSVTALEAIGLRQTAQDQVVVLGNGEQEQHIHIGLPDEFPEEWDEEWADVALLWRIVHLDGTHTDVYGKDQVPSIETDQYATLAEADESPLLFLNDKSPANMGTFIAPDIYQILETADYGGLEPAGTVALVYLDGEVHEQINPRHHDIGG